MKKSLFIVIEGLDGSGKSSASRKMTELLDAQFQNQIKLTFEPHDASCGGVYIRQVLMKKITNFQPRVLALAFAANRLDHCSREIRHGRITKAEAEEINNHFSIKTVDVTSFFKWLEVTKSGMEWFIHHKLKNSRHLISNQNDTNKEDFKLPIKLKRLLTPSISSKEDFILYDKGIDI